MSEKKLDITNARADIILALDNTATYESWLCIDTYIEQLQQENKELKKQYSKLEDKYIKNTPCCNENDCDLYKEYLNDKNILTEFEKWLEEHSKQQTNNMFFGGVTKGYEFALNKLQEMKGE